MADFLRQNEETQFESEKKLIGSFVLGHDPEVVRVASAAGLDFLIIDIEHGTPTRELIGKFVDVARGLDLRIFVRCPREEVPFLGGLLDRGLDGAIVAGAETPEDVRDIIRALKFTPLGTRGLNPFVPGTGYGTLDAASFMAQGNDRTSVWIMAEKVDLVKQIDQVTQLDGLDGVFFGPYDLSADLGMTGEVSNPAVTGLIEDAIRVIRKNGRSAGIFNREVASANKWADQGVSFLTVGFDWALLLNSWKRIVEDCRK